MSGIEQASAGAALAAQTIREGHEMAYVLNTLGGVSALADGALLDPEAVRAALQTASAGSVDPEDFEELASCLPEVPMDWGMLVSYLTAISSRGAWFSS